MLAGIGWWLLLLTPEILETRRLPEFNRLSDHQRLAPGSVAFLLGAILASTCRARRTEGPDRRR
jgi:hypothetical protein